MPTLILAHDSIADGIVVSAPDVSTGFQNIEGVSAAMAASADEVVLISDGCSEPLRSELAALVRAMDVRVIEVRGGAFDDHGNPLSAACAGVVAGFGVEAGLKAALGALQR